LIDAELRNRMVASRFMDLQAFIDRSVEVINDSCYPSEAELYGTWCLLHADEFKTKYLNHISLNKKFHEWTTDEIAQAINENQDKDTIAVHTWSDN
jgi:hypothetical protein